MRAASDVLFGFVAFLHFGFLVLESFLWTRPFGRRTFGQSREQAEQTAVMAKNQGLYNGFLAAGLVWALVEGHDATGDRARLFFGACVVVAGVVGTATTGRRTIMLIQSVPAALALALFALAR